MHYRSIKCDLFESTKEYLNTSPFLWLIPQQTPIQKMTKQFRKVGGNNDKPKTREKHVNKIRH